MFELYDGIIVRNLANGYILKLEVNGKFAHWVCLDIGNGLLGWVREWDHIPAKSDNFNSLYEKLNS